MNDKKRPSNNLFLPKGIKPEQLAKQLNSAQGKFAEVITQWAGSITFVYFHVIWFGFWIVANTGLLHPFVPIFDPFPYGLLTMVVSLEAIFLSTFIMIAQNRQALVDTYRELQDEKEQKEEEKEHDELEQDVEEISQDVDEIGRDIDKIQAGLNDLIKSVGQMQTRVMTVERQRTSKQDGDKTS
jgi:uncharacterized membrane protein